MCCPFSLTLLPHSKCVHFLPTPSNFLWYQLSVLRVSSILTLTGNSTDPTDQGLCSIRLPPLQMPIASSRCPGYTQLLFDLTTNQFPMMHPILIQLLVRIVHRTQGDTYIDQCIIKEMIWQMNNRQVKRYKHRSVFRPCGGVMHRLPSMWMCSPTQKLSQPCTIRILWRLPQ